MKKFLLLIFCLGLLPEGKAQISFKVFIDTLNSSFANSVRQCTDGGYAFCGGNLNAEGIAGKLDSLGNLIWIRNYQEPDFFHFSKIREHPVGGYLALGNTYNGPVNIVKLYRLNRNGDTLWTQQYNLSSTDGSLGLSLVIMANGNYAVAGFVDLATSQNPFLMITDSSGNALDTLIYQTPGRFNGLCERNNELAMTGYLNSQSTPGGLDYVVFGADTVCDSLWSSMLSTTMQSFGNAIVPTANGYISCGLRDNQNVYLVNSDTIGNINWTKVYLTGNRPVIANDITTTSDSGFAMVGSTYHVNILDFDLILIKTDAAGDTLWTRKFNEGSDERGNSLMQTSDGGYILGGSSAVGMYIIKTDTMGNVTSTVGVSDLSIEKLHVFPNPSHGIVSIASNFSSNEESLFSVTDATGRIVYSEKLRVTPEQKLDLTHLKNGIYFLKLNVKGEEYAGKIVIKR